MYIPNVLIQTPISNYFHPKCHKPNCPFRMTMAKMAINKQAINLTKTISFYPILPRKAYIFTNSKLKIKNFTISQKFCKNIAKLKKKKKKKRQKIIIFLKQIETKKPNTIYQNKIIFDWKPLSLSISKLCVTYSLSISLSSFLL